ncbi:hypothetical protein BDQ12DRAFT_691796 [Crucibulum laeve]|uniref:Uncharacterized protein n=1 Tax=Crucibulum laeve TaxID=68775 RepID=A0A5C3LIT3_9AGAR|nr:hypothetical protein BDQ12DRAFT_691796 [Crucibulum laeve]
MCSSIIHIPIIANRIHCTSIRTHTHQVSHPVSRGDAADALMANPPPSHTVLNNGRAQLMAGMG